MKICLINNLYEPYARGGAEKVVQTIVRGLVAAGHEVFIITTKPWFKRPPATEIYYLNSWYHNLGKLPKFFRFFWHIWNVFDIIGYIKVKKILKKEKCDLVITNNLMGVSYLVPLLIKRLKLNHWHIVHDIQLIHPSGLLLFGKENLINSWLAKNYAGLNSWLFGSPKTVIFPSRWLRGRYLDKVFFVKSKRIVLPNPVELIPGRNENNHRFLYLGQIEKHKGISLLIQAFKKVKKEFSQAELLIAGSGSEYVQLKNEVIENQGIKFLGWQNEEEVKKLLQTSRCLVMPTLCYENCPAVILEAFSAGLPVIAADIGGISELAGENAGILFNPGNADDLADKMAWALKNNLTEIINAAREKAIKLQTKNYIRKLEELARS